jgi:hypothetical protein
MYVTAEAVTAARLAACEHFGVASRLCLESSRRLADLYASVGRTAFGLAGETHRRHDAGLGGSWVMGSMLRELSVRHGPDLLAGHVVILGETYEGLVRLMGAQWHATSRLARQTLEQSAWIAPPELEGGIDTAMLAIDAGDELADDLVAASVDACEDVGSAVRRRIRRR